MSHQDPVDLDATDACPLAGRCENCGADEGLDVMTAGISLAVYCLTLCKTCADAGETPGPEGSSRAVERVLLHCGHLGIDVAQMVAQIERERAQ